MDFQNSPVFPKRVKHCIQGFTMIEVMLVVIIIGVLASMVISSILGRVHQARLAAAQADIDANISTALDLYEMDNGQYPTTEQGLLALLKKPTTSPVPQRWNGPYLKKKRVPMDPWGNPYNYVSPGTHNPNSFDMSSFGPDGVESEDDIVNWAEL